MSNGDMRPHLDHVFLTVDARTLKEIQETPFLTEEHFGRFRIKNATSTLIGPYRTANVAGRSTFIEFFPDSAPPFPGVRVGMVMSFERPGGTALAHERLESLGVPVRYELVRRAVEGHDQPQPWYHLLRPDFGNDSPFTLFLSEITPEYFDRIGARRTPDGRQTREAYLAAAMKAPQSDRHYFGDLRRVVLRLSASRALRLQAVLEALGYLPRRAEGMLRLEGLQAVIELVEDTGAGEYLAELGLSLTRPWVDEAKLFRFGSGTSLALSPNGQASALWQFGRGSASTVGVRHG